MRILAVDPGDKRIGVAISDPTGTIANPLTVLKFLSRQKNAENIANLAKEHKVETIVIGQSLGDDGEPTIQGRKSIRLAATIRNLTKCQVVLWDESGSTQTAQNARIAMNLSKKKRKSHPDSLAATVILQSYLETRFSRQKHAIQ